jgi:hypothetical protein
VRVVTDDIPVPRDRRRTAIIIGGLVIAANFAVIAIRSTDESQPTSRLPTGLAGIIPGCNTIARPQDTVGAEFLSGYTGELSVDGTPLPLDEYDHNPASTGVVSWRPGPGKTLREFAPGTHTLSVQFHSVGGSDDAQIQSFSCSWKVG